MKLRIDFETYSELDLEQVGAFKYAKHPSTKILMMAYKEYKHDCKLWEPGEEIPEEVFRADRFYAHNAVFEYLIWANCGERAGLPQVPGLSSFIDVMALCGKYGYPLKLEKAALALNCDVQKNPKGKALIKKFCSPTGFTKDNAISDWADFRQYCIDDVNTMEEIIERLPHHELCSIDQRIWELTQQINMRGVPVNAEEAAAVYKYVDAYKEAHAERLPELTNGAVTKPTQVKRIKDWCAMEGYPMPNGLGAQLIEDALDSTNPPPPHVAEVLEIRKEMGSSSANKFKLAEQLEYNGRIHMSFIQFGATTGRYASWNFQMHNLAKLCAKDPDALFRKFQEIEEIENPFRAAKSLVRALIKAPDGKQLCVADWSGIETHLLFWFVEDKETLNILRNRGDLYRIMASEVYKVRPEDVDKDTQRPLGKALILGCGYGMGFQRFKEAAKSFGVDVTLQMAKAAVNAYRYKFRLVQRCWYELTSAARRAIQNPGREIGCYKVTFIFDGVHLWTMLPSNRKLCYPNACIKDGDVQYWGVNATTRQWSMQRLTPSQNIENIIQAIALDILNESVININAILPEHEHIGHIHDENITLVPEGYEEALEHLINVMCIIPKWAEGLPLFAEGYMSKRFKK